MALGKIFRGRELEGAFSRGASHPHGPAPMSSSIGNFKEKTMALALVVKN